MRVNRAQTMAETAAGRPRLPEGDLDWPVESVPADGVTEIRVHGVGGTPPAAMLDEPGPRQVTGDQIAGMWRGSDQLIGSDRRWHREAYSWGGLTSKALSSALWLVLLPFAMLNLAGWMSLGDRGTAADQKGAGKSQENSVTDAMERLDWRIVYQQALVRMIALAATWTYVLFAAQLSMDLAAWQCAQSTSCRVGGWWSFLGLAEQPARAVVVAAAVPVLILGGLWLVSGQSKQRYEDYRPASNGDPAGIDLARITLTHKDFWTGAAYAARTRRLHVTSSLLLVAALILAVAESSGRFHPVTVGLTWTVLVLLGVCVLAAGWEKLRAALFGNVVVPVAIAIVILLAAATLTWLQPTTPAAGSSLLPGVLFAFDAVIVIVYGLALIHLVIAYWALRSARSASWVRPSPLPAPFIAIAIGTWLMFAILSGVVVWVARWLSPMAVPLGDGASGDLFYPATYTALAQITVVALAVILAGLGIVAAVSFRRTSRNADLRWERAEWARHSLDGARQASVSEPWLRKVRSRLWLAGMARWAEAAVALAAIGTLLAVLYSGRFAYEWFGWPASALVIAGFVLLCTGVTLLAAAVIDEQGRWRRLIEAIVLLAGGLAIAGWFFLSLLPASGDPPMASPLDIPVLNAAVAATFLTAIPVVSVLVVRQAIRNPSTRRVVGIAWDVATFWPRAFHPLAPPSYAERAVPELACRIRGLLNQGHAVVVLGHSQGSVLTTAVLAQLASRDDHHPDRLSAITYGSPVAYLYMRWFPTYFTTAVLEHARDAVRNRAWVNFFRHTDPIGREVFAPAPRSASQLPTTTAGGGDCWLPDPPTDLYRDGDGEPVVRGHASAGYVRQSAFAAHLCKEVTELNERAL